MIPYEDLVNALTAWRARKGLPVAQTSNAWQAPPPVVVAAPPPPPAPAPRTAPPAAPPPKAAAPLVPPPLDRPSDDSLDVDEAALLEESHYENEGDDFAMAFAGDAPPHDGESTAIGGAPHAGAHHGHADAFGGETLLGEHDVTHDAPEHTHDEAPAEEDEDKNPIEW
ncbi:MAG TPA: hypothetical protein VGM88_17600 [Kofleriaceae bacterium]|jgi:hypothetical protein